MKKFTAALVLAALLATPASAAFTRGQAFAACLAAGAQRGLRIPRLCACIASAVAASRPATRAAALARGYAAAPACVLRTGRR